jgi:hypothetical protein
MKKLIIFILVIAAGLQAQTIRPRSEVTMPEHLKDTSTVDYLFYQALTRHDSVLLGLSRRARGDTLKIAIRARSLGRQEAIIQAGLEAWSKKEDTLLASVEAGADGVVRIDGTSGIIFGPTGIGRGFTNGPIQPDSSVWAKKWWTLHLFDSPFSTLTMAGAATIKIKGVTSGTLTIGAPTDITDYALTWPDAQGGAGTYLKNNGSGILSWDTPTTGGGLTKSAIDTLLNGTIRFGGGATSYAGVLKLWSASATGYETIQMGDMSGAGIGTWNLPDHFGTFLTSLDTTGTPPNLVTPEWARLHISTGGGGAFTKQQIDTVGTILNDVQFNKSLTIGPVGSFKMKATTSGTVTFNTPTDITDYTLTWPTAQASGTQYLKNVGGTLSWATPAGADTTVVATINLVDDSLHHIRLSMNSIGGGGAMSKQQIVDTLNHTVAPLVGGITSKWRWVNVNNEWYGDSILCNVGVFTSTTEPVRIRYDASNYIKFTLASNGATTLTAVGTNPSIFLAPGGTGWVGTAAGLVLGTTAVAPLANLHIQSSSGAADSPILAIREGANPTYGFTFKQDDLTTGDMTLDRVNANVSTNMLRFVRNTGNLTLVANFAANRVLSNSDTVVVKKDSSTTPGYVTREMLRLDSTYRSAQETAIRAVHSFGRKMSDETVSASTTLQDDDTLHFWVAANETWFFQINIAWLTNGAGDGFKFGINVPTSATLMGIGGYIESSTASTSAAVFSGGSTTDNGAGVSGVTAGSTSLSWGSYAGYVANSTNAGYVTLCWAQTTASGSTTVKAGSTIIAHRWK